VLAEQVVGFKKLDVLILSLMRANWGCIIYFLITNIKLKYYNKKGGVAGKKNNVV
jgi:hypothetical protein